VLTEIGPVEIEVPRDTESTFEPQIVRERQRRLTGVDEIVLSLTARGLTTGEIAAHFQEVYGAKISKDAVSRITEKVTDEMTEWLNRPLEMNRPGSLGGPDLTRLSWSRWSGIRRRSVVVGVGSRIRWV
jgi:putative transposase